MAGHDADRQDASNPPEDRQPATLFAVLAGADVVVIGGGIIGAACADALAASGAAVVLLERDVLAAGASGRNQGLFVTPSDPDLLPMAQSSLDVYLRIDEESPLRVRFDREPIGFLRIAEEPGELADLEEQARDAERYAGIEVDRLDRIALLELEPGLAADLAGGCLFHTGRRLDPTSLTVSLALRARENGARIREHALVRALLWERGAVRGVMTDEGPTRSDSVVLAAGPWSGELLRPLGIRIPVTGARGWLVLVEPSGPLLSRPIEWEGDPWREPPDTVTALELAGGARGAAIGTLMHPADDGVISLGSSREPAIAAEPDDPAVPGAILRRAIRFVPGIAEAPVRSTWWGIRPTSPDDRPLIGSLREGLVLATGHGGEGVLLGAGTASLVRSIVTGEESPFDPAPFDPARFG